MLSTKNQAFARWLLDLRSNKLLTKANSSITLPRKIVHGSDFQSIIEDIYDDIGLLEMLTDEYFRSQVTLFVMNNFIDAIN